MLWGVFGAQVSTCVSAISWCNVTEQPLDVTANGYKHGVTKKALGTAKARWSQHALIINYYHIIT